jgi:hypothetical protein
MHLDYARQVRDPHLVKDKAKLEKIHKFSSRMASRRWDAGYQELLEVFELSSLEEHRLDLKLGLLFKILHELSYFPETESYNPLDLELLTILLKLFPIITLSLCIHSQLFI